MHWRRSISTLVVDQAIFDIQNTETETQKKLSGFLNVNKVVIAAYLFKGDTLPI